MGAFTWEGSFASGVLKSHALSKELRYAAVAEFEVAQFCRAEPGFGKKTCRIKRELYAGKPSKDQSCYQGENG